MRSSRANPDRFIASLLGQSNERPVQKEQRSVNYRRAASGANGKETVAVSSARWVCANPSHLMTVSQTCSPFHCKK
jgi:hypothetical protein